MIRAFTMVLLMTWAFESIGQVRLTSLVLKPKQVYELKGSDILVVDTLIMMDSSVLLLNKLKSENFIHAKKVIFYRGSLIDGKGITGLPGRNGKTGITSSSPCSNGGTGTKGTDGTNGANGISLYLSFTDIVLRGVPTIDLSGGDGADGGKGGAGGGGGTGTRLCTGGNGGAGGAGSNGGNGGNGGALTFHATSVPELRSMLGERIIVHSYGGNLGSGGEGGGGGYAGLSPTGNSAMDGKKGKKGALGQDGIAGKPGAINFQNK